MTGKQRIESHKHTPPPHTYSPQHLFIHLGAFRTGWFQCLLGISGDLELLNVVSPPYAGQLEFKISMLLLNAFTC